MTMIEDMRALEAKTGKLWDKVEVLTKRMDAIEQDDGAEAFDRTEEASPRTGEDKLTRASRQADEIARKAEETVARNVSIFGTPPELIPDGGEEFVSGGFRALRFVDADGADCVVRVQGTGAARALWPSADHAETYVLSDLEDKHCELYILPARPWLLHWLSHFSEPMPGAVEGESKEAEGVASSARRSLPGGVVRTLSDGVGVVRGSHGEDVFLRWRGGQRQCRRPGREFMSNEWARWPWDEGEATWCKNANAWFEANKSESAPEPSPSNAPMTDEGDEPDALKVLMRRGLGIGYYEELRLAILAERARRDAETERLREELNDYIEESGNLLAREKKRLSIRIADLEAQLKAAKKRAPDADSDIIDLGHGGPWLGAARKWAQRNIPRGDAIEWDSREDVRVPFAALWEMAEEVAEAAIQEERQDRARETLEIKDRWKLEQKVEQLEAQLKEKEEFLEMCSGVLEWDECTSQENSGESGFYAAKSAAGNFAGMEYVKHDAPWPWLPMKFSVYGPIPLPGDSAGSGNMLVVASKLRQKVLSLEAQLRERGSPESAGPAAERAREVSVHLGSALDHLGALNIEDPDLDSVYDHVAGGAIPAVLAAVESWVTERDTAIRERDGLSQALDGLAQENTRLNAERDTALAQAATAREAFEGLRDAVAAIVEELKEQGNHAAQWSRFAVLLDKFPPLPEPGEGERVEPLRPRREVMWFARWMELKLRENDHKGGWRRDSVRSLYKRAKEEMEELEGEFEKEYTTASARGLIREAADVANMVMMVADQASLNRLPEPVEPETTESES